MTLGAASASAFIGIDDYDPTNLNNPAPGDLKLMMRFDYPGIKAFDQISDNVQTTFSMIMEN